MKYGLRFSVLASGSGGNACYVQSAHARILIDVGLSCREIERRLRVLGVEPDSLDAVILTHEHGDHVKGAGTLLRRYDLPVYTNRKTLNRAMKYMGSIARPCIIQTGQTLPIRDLAVETFTKCHDAGDPFGMVLACNGAKIGLITDLGRSTRLLEDRLKGCHAMILEFNHDPTMLDNGSYPLEIKRRIKGPDGHLSNKQAGDILRVIAHQELKFVVLAHLSESNNLPEMAHREASEALKACGLHNTTVLIGKQHEPTPLIAL